MTEDSQDTVDLSDLLSELGSGSADARHAAAADCIARASEDRDVTRYSSALRLALESPDVRVRRVVARGLRELGPVGVDLAPLTNVIATGLGDPDVVTRRALAEVFAASGDGGRGEDARLVYRALADPDVRIRAVVARTLARCADAGQDLAAHIPALVARLDDRAPEVREAAMNALDAIARQSPARAERIHRIFRVVRRIARER